MAHLHERRVAAHPTALCHLSPAQPKRRRAPWIRRGRDDPPSNHGGSSLRVRTGLIAAQSTTLTPHTAAALSRPPPPPPDQICLCMSEPYAGSERAAGEIVILPHPPLHPVGVPIGAERGCQQNDRRSGRRLGRTWPTCRLGRSSQRTARLAVGETAIPLHPPLHPC